MQRSKICLFLLCALCVGAFFIRADGIKWPKMHPDEHTIGQWIEKSAHDIYIKERVYPNGFFMLARPFLHVVRAVNRLSRRFDYHCDGIDRFRSVEIDGIYFGRWFNVWAGTLLCVIVFLFAARMTRSPWAGLFAACLIGFSQYAVEHSHYAETDIAALLCLAVALWLWAIARDTSRMRWFVSAAFVSGFAMGTKFTLTVLAVLVLAESVALARERRAGGWWKRLPGLLSLGLLFFGAGFICANPAVALNFNWFRADIAAEQRRVFAETMLNLGPEGARPWVKYMQHLWHFYGNALTLGLPWLALILTGMVYAAPRGARRYWSVLILFPAAFFCYWIFMAPWVRSQEFLLFLPSFAALAAVALAMLFNKTKSWRRLVVLFFALLALVVNGANGLKVAQLFGWKDTRLQAREWLQMTLPPENRLAAEFYSAAACPATLNPPLAIKKIEREGIKPMLDRGADYVLRAANVTGRGLHNPLTGELYPAPADNFRQFMSGSTLLCAWAPLPPQGLATFVSPVIELYGLKRFAPTVSLRAELPQPALIVNADQDQVGRQTYSPVGHGLGCARALLIDHMPQTIAVGGPAALDGTVFLVLNTLERPAVIHVRGFGIAQKVVLDPFDTAVVALKRSTWFSRAEPFEIITLQAEPVKDVLYIPCFARIAFTVSEAARICVDTARADKIAGYFPEELLEPELSPGLKCLLYAQPALRPMTERSARQAACLRTRLQGIMQTDLAFVSINGVSGYYYNQFARARLQQPYELAGASQGDEVDGRMPLHYAVTVLDLQLPEKRAGGPGLNQAPNRRVYCQELILPVLVARGKYELRGEVMLRLNEGQSAAAVPLTARFSGGTNPAGNISLQPGKWTDFRLVIQAGREIQPVLGLESPVAVQVHLRNLELGWNLAAALESVGNDLAAGRPIDEEPASLPALIKFPPWLALVGFDFDPGTKEVKCVFEALRDDTPKLAVVCWLKRHGEWRRKQAGPIGVKPWLRKGEREVVTVRLGEVFGEPLDIGTLGLGIETDVLWHPGVIPSATGGYVVPFADIRIPSQPARVVP